MIADPHTFIMDLARREVATLAAIIDSHLRVADDGEITILDEPALTAAWSHHLATVAVQGADISTSLSIIAAFASAADGPPNVALQQDLVTLVAPHTGLGGLDSIFKKKGNA
ncbi:MAG: hypothetical protein ACI9YM_001939 [Brevundimonas sp.]|jgi:hypothetical protein|uniref:hypothetical protein n=1 Tax=Brevundimonas sp. TaxID=1871086 RepID=UPI0039E3C379